jgi:hypothetical protein
MNSALPCILVALCFLLPLGTSAAPTNGTSPPEVINRLVANASKKFPGPVENDIDEKVLAAMATTLKQKKESRSLRKVAAEEFNFFTFESTPRELYTNGPAAIYTAEAKVTFAALHTNPPNAPIIEDGVSFNDGGNCLYITDKDEDHGHLVINFCLVRQRGAWKVHCYYIGSAPMDNATKQSLIHDLDLYAKNL